MQKEQPVKSMYSMNGFVLFPSPQYPVFYTAKYADNILPRWFHPKNRCALELIRFWQLISHSDNTTIDLLTFYLSFLVMTDDIVFFFLILWIVISEPVIKHWWINYGGGRIGNLSTRLIHLNLKKLSSLSQSSKELRNRKEHILASC